MSTVNPASAASASLEIPFWESLMEDCRWGKYMSDVELQAILEAARLAGPPSQALEVGAEGGRWAKVVADMGWKMTCTDIKEDALALCKRRIPDANIVLVRESDTTLPADSGSMPLVMCVEVPYVIEQDWFMRELARVNASGGYFIGVMNNRRSLRGAFYNLMRALNLRRGYPFYSVSYPKWRQRLSELGFDLVSERGYCWFPMKRRSNSWLIPVLARLERLIGLDRLPSLSPWIVLIARKR